MWASLSSKVLVYREGGVVGPKWVLGVILMGGTGIMEVICLIGMVLKKKQKKQTK